MAVTRGFASLACPADMLRGQARPFWSIWDMPQHDRWNIPVRSFPYFLQEKRIHGKRRGTILDGCTAIVPQTRKLVVRRGRIGKWGCSSRRGTGRWKSVDTAVTVAGGRRTTSAKEGLAWGKALFLSGKANGGLFPVLPTVHNGAPETLETEKALAISRKGLIVWLPETDLNRQPSD